MAKGSNLLLQGMTGKVGGIVLTKAGDGDTIMRSAPSVVRQPNTAAQQSQKSKFKLIVEIAAINKHTLRNYTKGKNANTSPYSTFIGTNVKNATVLNAGVPEVDYKSLRTVTGGGTDPYSLGLSVATSGTLTDTDTVSLAWTFDVNNPTHNANDKVGIVLIDTFFNVVKVETSNVAITANAASFDVPWPVSGDLFVIPFYLSGASGYGAEITQAVLISAGSTGSVISR